LVLAVVTVLSAESSHEAAAIAVLESSGAVPYTVQDANRVSVPPPAYNVVTLEPRAGGTFRTGRTGRQGYRLAVEARGQTYEGARQMREAAHAALRGVELVVDGERTTPLEFEGGQPVDDDDKPGWYSGLLLYKYVY
jgi:hypothetical protein